MRRIVATGLLGFLAIARESQVYGQSGNSSILISEISGSPSVALGRMKPLPLTTIGLQTAFSKASSRTRSNSQLKLRRFPRDNLVHTLLQAAILDFKPSIRFKMHHDPISSKLTSYVIRQAIKLERLSMYYALIQMCRRTLRVRSQMLPSFKERFEHWRKKFAMTKQLVELYSRSIMN